MPTHPSPSTGKPEPNDDRPEPNDQAPPDDIAARRAAATADIVDAMTDIMARPGWVNFVLTAALDDADKLLALRLIVGLHKTTIERAGHAMAAQWLREKHGTPPTPAALNIENAIGATDATAGVAEETEQAPGPLSAATPPLSSRGTRRDRSTHNALIEALSRPGWLDDLITLPPSDDIWQERAVGWLCRVIIRLFRDTIERESRALVARWWHDRDPHVNVRLIKGRRVRSPLRARRRASPPATGPLAE